MKKSKKLYFLLVSIFIIAVMPALSGCASVGDSIGSVSPPPP